MTLSLEAESMSKKNISHQVSNILYKSEYDRSLGKSYHSIIVVVLDLLTLWDFNADISGDAAVNKYFLKVGQHLK